MTPRWFYAFEAVLFVVGAALLTGVSERSLVAFMFGFCCAVSVAHAAGKLP